MKKTTMNTLRIALVAIMTMLSLTGRAFVVPEPLPGVQPYTRTPAQKAIGTTTDVLVLAMPVATLAGVLITKDWKGLEQGALTAGTTLGLTYLLKFCVHEQRPDRTNYLSFPSAHTSAAFATAAFVQRRYGWKLGIPAYAVATYIGWGRVFAKKHNWWDVLAGAAIGAGSAYIYTRPFARKHDLSVMPYTDGESLAVAASLSF